MVIVYLCYKACISRIFGFFPFVFSSLDTSRFLQSTGLFQLCRGGCCLFLCSRGDSSCLSLSSLLMVSLPSVFVLCRAAWGGSIIIFDKSILLMYFFHFSSRFFSMWYHFSHNKWEWKVQINLNLPYINKWVTFWLKKEESKKLLVDGRRDRNWCIIWSFTLKSWILTIQACAFLILISTITDFLLSGLSRL